VNAFLDTALTSLATPVAHALIHFLWQGSLVALALGGTLLLTRGRSAALRYRLACAALLLMVVLPVITAVRVVESGIETGPRSHAKQSPTVFPPSSFSQSSSSQSSPMSSADTRTATENEPPAGIAGYLDAVAGKVIYGNLGEEHTPWIFRVWLAGVLMLSTLHLGGWFKVQQLRRLRTEPVPAEWQDCVDRLCRRMGIPRAVRLLRSALVEVPAVIGWLRPVVLIPMSALSGLPPRQLECILAHELAHIWRRDYLMNLLQVIAETLLFYHPAVWWVSRQIRLERENCCDDIAVRLTGDRLAYARALVELEELRLATPRLAQGADGGSLLRRVQRLVGGRPMSNHFLSFSSRRSLVSGTFAVVLILICGTVLVFAAQNRLSGDLELASGLHAETVAQPVESAEQPAATKSDDREERTDTANLNGRWSAEREDDRLELEIRDRRHGKRWNMTVRVPVDDFTDLEFGENVTFGLLREAGTFRFAGGFEGTAKSAEGDGTFTFAVDQSYVNRLKEMGIRGLEDHELLVLAAKDLRTDTVKELKEMGYDRIKADELLSVAIFEVTPAYIRQMARLGYEDIELDTLVAMRIHGVDEEFVAEMQGAGYLTDAVDDLIAWRVHSIDAEYAAEMEETFGELHLDKLLALKIHNVTPEYGESLRRAGVDLEAVDDLLAFRIHGVTADYIQEMQEHFGPNLAADEILSFRIHGVDPDYAKEMKEAGLGELPADELLAMKIHGVTPEYIHDLEASGYTDMDADDLLAWKIHGVTPGFIRQVSKLGYDNLDEDELVAWRIHGVTADFIEDLAELGYENIEADDLVKMRIHNVTPRWIRHLHEKGIDHLDVDDLIKLRISGVEL
jgi:beta-lactamase regulating signal transducer with metallopeptidase domain